MKRLPGIGNKHFSHGLTRISTDGEPNTLLNAGKQEIWKRAAVKSISFPVFLISTFNIRRFGVIDAFVCGFPHDHPRASVFIRG